MASPLSDSPLEAQDSAANSPPILTPEGNDDHLSDNESDLSDVDEAQFDDFDPTNITIEDRPQVAVDESNVKLLGVHKRKRTDAEIEEARKKKKKERGRERPKKPRKRRDGSEPFSGGEEIDGKRSRKRKEGGEKASASSRAKETAEIDEANLTPEESTFECLSNICK
jgi:transcription factor SPN1